MCADCKHWKRDDIEHLRGLVFAPCALKPDVVVKDKRTHFGNDLQAYTMQSTYECSKFDSNK